MSIFTKAADFAQVSIIFIPLHCLSLA
jgi:hypothetical protein